MAGLLSIGVSGLHASQAQLQTTGHNITNVEVLRILLSMQPVPARPR